MNIWKKKGDEPSGVLPANLITKVGIVAIAVLLGAMILTISFSGGGGEAEVAEIEVPEAADQALQQRAQAAIAAEAGDRRRRRRTACGSPSSSSPEKRPRPPFRTEQLSQSPEDCPKRASWWRPRVRGHLPKPRPSYLKRFA